MAGLEKNIGKNIDPAGASDAPRRRDRLAALNDEIRDNLDDTPSPWLPLESNPDVFTSFAHRVGLPTAWRFVDVWGLEPALLATVPRPVAAAILLFPCSERIYAARAREEDAVLAAAAAAPDPGRHPAAARACFHIEQVAAFGNACGTIAAVHALTNATPEGGGAGADGAPSAIAAFRAENLARTPAERGHALLTANALKSESDGAAVHAAAQTACPDRDGPDLDHHYCTFVPVRGDGNGGAGGGGGGGGGGDAGDVTMVVELDGTKCAPIVHGPVAAGSDFLAAVAEVVRAKFMAVEPESIEFSLMALCKSSGGS